MEAKYLLSTFTPVLWTPVWLGSIPGSMLRLLITSSHLSLTEQPLLNLNEQRRITIFPFVFTKGPMSYLHRNTLHPEVKPSGTPTATAPLSIIFSVRLWVLPFCRAANILKVQTRAKIWTSVLIVWAQGCDKCVLEFEKDARIVFFFFNPSATLRSGQAT